MKCHFPKIRDVTSFFKKMANEIIDDLLLEVSHDSPESEVKRQKLIECVLTGNSKQYLGKVHTEEQINKLSAEELDKLFSNYEAKLSGQMVKSLGKSIIMIGVFDGSLYHFRNE